VAEGVQPGDEVPAVSHTPLCCTHVCIATTENIARSLVEAVAKAAVFQTLKPFGDPRTVVAPLSAELVTFLMGGSCAEGSAGVLSDLMHNLESWTISKKSFLSSFVSAASQSDTIAKLKLDLTRCETSEGFNPSDRERMSRELLLRVGNSAALRSYDPQF